MTNKLVQSIKLLKQQKSMDKSHKKHPQQPHHKDSPKRNAPAYDLTHRIPHNSSQSIFKGFTFCFPFVDKELTPKQKQLLSQSIQIEGGKVVELKDKSKSQDVDFLLVSKQVKPQVVDDMVEGKLNYKEMLDYNFITDSLKEGRLKNCQKYSLYVNIKQMWGKEEHESKKQNKKIKKDSDNDTVKLSEDQPQQSSPKKHTQQATSHNKHAQDEQQEYHGKRQIQDVMLGHKTQHSFSINKFIADELTKLMKIYQTERDIGRKIAYMKAAAVIKTHDKEIESEKDVENIKGIGKKISDKIKELLSTGKINKLETLQSSEKNIILGQLCEVWGIGPSKAQQLYNSGIKSIEQLKKRTELLTKNQKLGLKYHEEFQTKIPRQKVTKMFDYVRNILSKLTDSIDNYRMEVCGSYRRGKAFCGDMDIIISRKDGTYQKSLLQNLVNQLERSGFLTDHLTHPKVPQGRASISYMGVCRFEQPTHHRIDIKYYPIQQFAFAILYFTGSGMFNRMMRLHCMKLGLNLSDHGLTPKMQKGVIWIKPIPTCYTQQDIFKFVGLDYKTPKERQM